VDLPGYLTSAAAAFEQALATRSTQDRDLVIDRLEALIGEIPVRLNDAIDNAATRLELRQLLALMASVGELLRPAAGCDTELKPMLEGIAALDGLRGELALRVREHGVLQSLDNFLRETVEGQRRSGTSGRIGRATLLADWNHIRRLRARFKEPFSPEVAEGHALLQTLEPEIEAAVLRGDEIDAVARLVAYFNEAGDLFRLVDGKLKEFCFELRDKTRPLKTILDMCRAGVRDA
jgi:hypothetical protein